MIVSLAILIISIPIFYVIGLLAVIRGFFDSSNRPKNVPSGRRAVLSELVQELSSKPQQTTVSQLLSEYSSELTNLGTVTAHATPVAATKVVSPPPVSIPTPNFQNWYEDNSINILLYIGAFLIVASASIFVGFQWETIGNMAKVYTILLLTLAFFISGGLFINIPKIKNAGSTFLAIGSLLIPFCGIAVYNFWLKSLGVPAETVWLTTTCVSLLASLSLIYFLKNVLYTYLLGLGILSFMLSLVQIGGLPNTYYILSSIVSGILMLLAQLYFVRQSDEAKSLIAQPLEIVSNVTLPLALTYGVITAANGGFLFSLEAAIATFLGGVFYTITYLAQNRNWALVVAESLFSFSYVILCRYLAISGPQVVYCYVLFSVILMGVAYYQKSLKKIEPSQISTLISLFLIIGTSFYAYYLKLGWTVVVVTGCIVLLGIVGQYITKYVPLYLVSAVYLAISIYLGVITYYPDVPHHLLLAILYSAVGVSLFALAMVRKNVREELLTFGVASGGFFLLGLFFSYNTPLVMAGISIIIAIASFVAARLLTLSEFSYVAVFFINIVLFNLLRFREIENIYYPIAYVTMSYLLLFGSKINGVKYKKELRNAALVSAIIIPVYFGIESLATGNTILERNCLIAAYALFALYIIDAVDTKDTALGYVASAIGMVTYIWQMKYLHMTEIEVYTLPLGVYFMLLAYTRQYFAKNGSEEALRNIGMLLLLVPPFLQSYGTDGYKYALLLGIMGVGFVAWGVTSKYKAFVFAGVAALVLSVFSQVADFLYSLPRWVITGGVGMLILAIAVYLLLRRKEIIAE